MQDHFVRTLFIALILASSLAGGALSAADPMIAPAPATVVEMPDDLFTRGDWLGAYGRHAYMLCGMRSPRSLYGGPGWPISFEAVTSDPEESVRAWRSTMPFEQDRSILLEPNGLTRTPAIFDDHGEARPMGKGPDLHLRLDVPEGPYLLSLYFFEADWIQYRAYTLSICADTEPQAPPLLTTRVADFAKGRYKRFAVLGPARLRVEIARDRSPNAIISGVFLDRIERPDLQLLEAYLGQTPAEAGMIPAAAEPEGAEQEAIRMLQALQNHEVTPLDCFAAELALHQAMQEMYNADFDVYLRQAGAFWRNSLDRIAQARSVVADDEIVIRFDLLGYLAAANVFDFGAADTALRNAASAIETEARKQGNAASAADVLDRMCGALLSAGRRGEAEIALGSFGDICLEGLPPAQALDRLRMMGAKVLSAHVPRAMAAALLAWESKTGETLGGDDALLAANLLYLSGRNLEAAARFKAVARQMTHDRRRRWILVAEMTALLRADKLSEALEVLQEVRSAYPRDPIVHEATFRLASYYYDERRLPEARSELDRLLSDKALSAEYRQMCEELMGRIEHLEELRKARESQGAPTPRPK